MDEATFYGTEEKEMGKMFDLFRGKINISTASVAILTSLSPRIDQIAAKAVAWTTAPSLRSELRSIPGWNQVAESAVKLRYGQFSIRVLSMP
jgi:hypothetical protein